jgi:hypothetical protein
MAFSNSRQQQGRFSPPVLNPAYINQSLQSPVLNPVDQMARYHPITGALLPPRNSANGISAHSIGQGVLGAGQQLANDIPKIGGAIADGANTVATGTSLGSQNFLRGLTDRDEVSEEEMVDLNPNLVGKYLGNAGRGLYDNFIKPVYETGYDTTADFVDGALNLGSGIMGGDKVQEQFRYRNEPDPNATAAEPVADEEQEVAPILTQAAAETHVMPDGTVMDGAEHSDDLGVLSTDTTDTSVSKEPYVAATGTGNSKKDGILSSIGKAASVDRSGTATGNKRDATGLSVPRQKIDMSEMLMRVGGAISGSAADGALASINSGTNTWGAIQDENRAMEMQQYEADQAAYENEENRKVQRMTSGRLNAAAQKDAIEQKESFAKRNQRIGSLDTLIDDLTAAGDNVTGLWDGTGRALLDRATGNRNANLRLRLEDQRVDAALTKVEQTKGAISNREMDLFLSPMPKLTDSEEVWIDWMTMQRNVAAKMNQVASGGFDSTGTRYLNAVDEDAPLSPELEAFLAKYPPK